jgi:hypothetical protein
MPVFIPPVIKVPTAWNVLRASNRTFQVALISSGTVIFHFQIVVIQHRRCPELFLLGNVGRMIAFCFLKQLW